MSSWRSLKRRLDQVETIVESRNGQETNLDLTVLSDAELMQLEGLVNKGWKTWGAKDWNAAEPILLKAAQNGNSSPYTAQGRPTSTLDNHSRRELCGESCTTV